jgi:two-component system cell cycle response regulator DivK
MPIGRILYVEDNLENRILIKRVLEAEGYIVEEAADGLTSIDMAVTNPPDLILMDINLPDIDGYEATTRLRKTAKTAHVPIVALTANVMQGDRERSLQAGCDGYIPKPIDVDHLPAQIASYLGTNDGRQKAIEAKR